MAVLWLRMFLLYMVADEATATKVGFLNESPQDRSPMWVEKEVRMGAKGESILCTGCGMNGRNSRRLMGSEHHFDQGPFGTKPTTIGTNMETLEQLDGVRGTKPAVPWARLAAPPRGLRELIGLLKKSKIVLLSCSTLALGWRPPQCIASWERIT